MMKTLWNVNNISRLLIPTPRSWVELLVKTEAPGVINKQDAALYVALLVSQLPRGLEPIDALFARTVRNRCRSLFAPAPLVPRLPRGGEPPAPSFTSRAASHLTPVRPSHGADALLN